VRFVPLGDPLGVEVTDVDWTRPPTPSEAEDLMRTIAAHNVLVFRGHNLAPAQQVAFARAFGELETFQPHPSQIDEHPEIFRVSNVEGRGYLDVGLRWHTDNSNLPRPAWISMLFSVEIPPEGGETRFMNMYDAYERMPEDLQRRIEGRTAHHQGTRYIGVGDRAGGAHHPLVRTHPLTGQKALYVNFNLTRSTSGLDEVETQRLLDDLRAYMETMPYYSHKWRMGDVVAWDNACTSHMVTKTDPTYPRTLNRLTVIGPEPC
jgi:taurine dioxygenase